MVNQEEKKEQGKETLGEKIRRIIRENFVLGLVLFGPIFGTIYITIIIFNLIDGILSGFYERVLGFRIPGLGIITLFVLIILTGFFARTYLARFLIQSFESIIMKIPLAKSIYPTIKNIAEILQQSKEKIGRPSVVSIGNNYIAGLEISSHGQTSVFLVPSSPNPTTGFILLVPKSHVKNLNTSMEEFTKFIASLGIYNKNIVKLIEEIKENRKEQ